MSHICHGGTWDNNRKRFVCGHGFTVPNHMADESIAKEIIDTSKVNRLEIIDHTPCVACGAGNGVAQSMCTTCNATGSIGRQVVMWDDSKKIELSFQDNNRTLKVFVSERVPRERKLSMSAGDLSEL